MWGPDDRRKIEFIIAPDVTGVTTISMGLIDLQEVNRFVSVIRNTDPASQPVRLRVELISEADNRFSAFEYVLVGGQETHWAFSKPNIFGENCRVTISVAWAIDAAHSAPANIVWTNPRFTSRRGLTVANILPLTRMVKGAGEQGLRRMRVCVALFGIPWPCQEWRHCHRN